MEIRDFLVYIAGPYRAPTEWQLVQHIRAAEALAIEVWKLGAVAICPHLNTMFMDGIDIDRDTFINGDLEILRRCDAIFMLSGWDKSEGARKEWELAKELDMPVIYQDDNMTEKVIALMNLKWR